MPLDPGELKRLAGAEMEVLRKELHDLKECQFKFLSTTPILTGFLLGLPQIFGKVEVKHDEPHSLLYLTSLLSLLVLLPAWWVFFDKAKTVTRIVGYYRLLEAVARGDFRPRRFLGWERSLEIFRRARSESSLSSLIEESDVSQDLTDDERRRLSLLKLSRLRRTVKTLPRFFQAAFLSENQLYWLLAYDTFAILSLVSLSIPVFTLANRPDHFVLHWGQWVIVLLAALSVVWCCIENAMVLSDLMWGHYSYTANHLIWISIMAKDGGTPDEGPAERYARSVSLLQPAGSN